MNAADVNSELAHERSLVRACDDELGTLKRQRHSLMSVEPWRFRQVDVNAVDVVIAQKEQERSNRNERITALEAALPSAEERQKGNEQAASFWEDAVDAEARFPLTLAEFMTVLANAEKSARALAAVATQHRAARFGVHDLWRRLGLDSPMPDALTVDTSQMKLAAAIGALISDVALNLSVDTSTNAEVLAARTQVESRLVV